MKVSEDFIQFVGQCVLDGEKRKAFFDRGYRPDVDKRTFHSVKEKLRLIEALASIREHKHIRPLSMSPVIRQSILPSAAHYSSFLRFVENRKALVIQYTKECNCNCSHCIVNSGSKRRERIDRKLLHEILKAGFRQGYSKVMFTGGEPLIREAELLEDISFCKSLGYITSLGTNGFWGSTYDSSVKMLAKLANRGVRRIALSTGRFHLPSISFTNIQNILDASQVFQEMNIQVKLTGIERDDQILTTLKEHYPEIHTRIIPLIPTGRASALPKHYFNPKVTIDTNGRCADVCRPFIGYDGTIYRCCNIDDKNKDSYHFVLGNFKTNGLPELSTDMLRRFLFLIGPAGLARWLRNSSFDTTCIENKSFNSTCHLCGQLLDTTDLTMPILALMASPNLKRDLDIKESWLAKHSGLEKMLDGKEAIPS